MRNAKWSWHWLPGAAEVVFIRKDGEEFIRFGYTFSDAISLCDFLNGR